MSIAETLTLIGAGAADVVEWTTEEAIAEQLAARFGRWSAVDELVSSPAVADTLVGDSPRWQRVLRDVVEVARFTSSSILVTGESGTGKELVARLVHELDGRSHKEELVLVDCTTIVPSLSGSEFFGHEKGAFTGAVAARDGAFALAHEGTLFLDEVGELPLTLQPELLRVVQEGAYKRVGSNVWHRTLFRLVCATNRELLDEVSAGRFRHDLYHRIAAWCCSLPSLAERRADIPSLARHFLRIAGGPALELSDAVVDYLARREYSGNVRELRYVVLSLRNRHVGSGPITLADLPADERALAVNAMRQSPDPSEPQSLVDALRDAVRRQVDSGRSMREIVESAREMALDEALLAEGGSVTRAAARLGMTPRAIQLRRARSSPSS
ncbi:MAG TPA: sigma 54-interacting transcriptional regulator [Gaiellaceae bacterium]|nr:sigma 54-interacting transcriptional regulator [Gaiellaceae bacterium]